MMIMILPFFIQGLLMGVDEFYCHRRRTMRKWERWGHPVDTLVFSSCLAFLFLADREAGNIFIYGFLSLLSCLTISKDEWEHRGLCTGFENWLHSLLFMIHPVVLIWAGYLWWSAEHTARQVIAGALVLSMAFLFYQLIYWNWWRRDQQ